MAMLSNLTYFARWQKSLYLLGEVAICLNSHLSDQLWLPSHHYGRVTLVVHLQTKISQQFCFGGF